jgi:serine/threonine protein kinase
MLLCLPLSASVIQVARREENRCSLPMQVRNEKARRFLMNMRRKPGVNFEQYFPRADKGALRLLKRMLAFDPAQRPTSEEALADPYFAGLSQPGREPSAQPVSKLSFDFERRKLTTDEVRSVPSSLLLPLNNQSLAQVRALMLLQVRDLIYREILEYHPHMLADYLQGNRQQPSYVYPSAVDNFKRQFAHLEGGSMAGRIGHHGILGQVCMTDPNGGPFQYFCGKVWRLVRMLPQRYDTY